MFFGKKEKIVSPVDGMYIPLNEVNDPVFSQGIIGDGVAVIPSGEEIFSPVDGVISMIADQKHGIGITMKDGTELIIHMGIDTVELKGEPFTIYKNLNDKVKQGEVLAHMDINAIEKAGKETVILIIVIGKQDLNKVYETKKSVKCKEVLIKG